MIICETERLIIRQFKKTDAPFYVNLVNTPSWLKYIGERNIHNQGDAEEYLQNTIMKAYDKLGFGFYLVKEKSIDKAIGTCGLIKRDELEFVDIGFAFLPEYESNGYGFEAASAIINYGKNDLKLNVISAFCTKDNLKSIHLIQKLGFHFDKKIQISDEKELLNLYLISL